MKNPGDHVIDITDKEAVISTIAQYKPKVVINCAAYTDVDASEQNAAHAYLVNGTAVGYIADGCNRAGAKLVHISTDYIFAGDQARPYREDDHAGPLGVYGKSKLAGELSAHLAKDHLIVRTAWLFGRSGKNFVSTILKRTDETDVISVVDDQRGSPTYTVDLTDAIVRLLGKNASGIFHVTNSGSCTWCEYAQAVLDKAGIKDVKIMPITTAESNRPAPRPAYSVLDCSKYQETTSHQMRSWRDALRDFLTSTR
ncbi:MAG TPA: dTDP-4-dehydrorhamnose reductase [bacterium]|nr:dTDP-4-dehydrorhamnose reductase [bacterium]